MTLEEQYTRLLEKERTKELLPFLQSLTEEERIGLAPSVKKLAKDYFAFVQRGNTWSSKATDKQRKILYYAIFACYNKKDVLKENPAWLLEKDHLENFLSWYCPSWLSEYINSFASQEWVPYSLNYGYLMDLTKRGFIQPVPELIAKTLVPFVYEQSPQSRQTIFRPERLELYGDTLNEHIWHLFQHETTLHFSNRYLYVDGKPMEKSWIDVFLLYAEKGKIDKQRLLQEALLASNRNFNKNLSGWFAELFTTLNPTPAQALPLQPELFNLFASPHSKVVTTALNACKTIVEDPLFDGENFLSSVPLLLASSTKSVVTTTLQLLEKLAKKEKEKRGSICLLTTGALIHKEEGLQTRAAKLINKYGAQDDEALKESIGLYRETLFSGAKALLQPYYTVPIEIAEEANLSPVRIPQKGKLTDETALPSIHSVDELVFLAAQAFDNNASWHIDLLPAALIKLNAQIKGEDLTKLEPAMQRALKLFFGDWRSNQGQLDYLLASFFLDYCLFLVSKFPAQSGSAKALFAGYMNKSEENKKIWQEHGTNTSFLASFKAEGDKVLYTAYTKLLNTILLCLKEGQTLPMLSAPTHAPAWIDPVVLVERLALHQEQDAPPDDTDLQIALSRCWLHGTEASIQRAAEKLHGELKSLLLFLLDPAQRPTGPFTMDAAWMMAALSKSPHTIYSELESIAYSSQPRELYTGQYPYQVCSETYTYDKHNWENGNHRIEKATAQRKVIRLDLSAQHPKKEVSGFKKFISRLTGNKNDEATEPTPLLYDYLRIKNQWLFTEERDIRRIYLLTPNNPEPLLALSIDKCLSDPAFVGETTKRFVTNVLQVLHESWRPLGDTGYLFLAASLVSSDKTAASYVAELWMRGVEEGNFDSGVLGAKLGQLESIEFAPLKRFTDLVVNSLLNVSAQHNKALEEMLTTLLKALPEVPIKGLKKLLEIYHEVVRLNGKPTTDEHVIAKLKQWKENNALNKTVKSLEA